MIVAGEFHSMGVKADGTAVTAGKRDSKYGSSASDVSGWRDIGVPDF